LYLVFGTDLFLRGDRSGPTLLPVGPGLSRSVQDRLRTDGPDR